MKSFEVPKAWQNISFCKTRVAKTTSRKRTKMISGTSCRKSGKFFFLIFGQRCQIRCQKIGFLEKKIVLRCPKLIWIAKREASHSKIMFYRDTQTLVIHISRGTCTRGDIVIHITFALAQHISQRGFKKVIWIVAYLKGVVLGLYETPTNSACRVTTFFFCL